MRKPLSGSRNGASSAGGNGRAAMAGGKLVRMTLSERIYETLKERILDQRIQAGARLNIDALSRELQVSSSPIREALVRLEAEKLIVSELYSGYSVAPQPTVEYFTDLLECRIVIEGHCAKVGAERKDRATVAMLKQAYEKMAQSPGIGKRYREYQRFVQADGKFHQVLVDSACNQVFSNVYASLHALILQSRLYFNTRSDEQRLQEVLREHERIIEAFEAGDGAAAQAAVRDHLEGGRRRLLSGTAENAEGLKS
jgi:DNA-binding GntR family transcriptional regulator